MLEIHNSEEDEEEDSDDEEYSGDFGPHSRVFVAKAPICAIARRFQEPVPQDRSWPILEWSTIIGPANFGYCHRIDGILNFVYRGDFEPEDRRAISTPLRATLSTGVSERL